MISYADLFETRGAMFIVGLACCRAPFELETKGSRVRIASRATMSKPISGSPAREHSGEAGDDSSLKIGVPDGFIYFASSRMMPTVYRVSNAAASCIPHILPSQFV
jgi:hypothetical protein